MKSLALSRLLIFIILVSICVRVDAQPRTASSPNISLFPVLQGGRWGYIDRTGRIVVKPQFEDADFFHDDLGLVHLNRTGIYIDRRGKVVIRNSTGRLGYFSEGLASLCMVRDVKPNSEIKYTCGYINKNGITVINPQFDVALKFSEGLAAVKIGEHWGYINKSGTYVINPKLEGASDFSEGLALVSEGGIPGFVDKLGRSVIKPHSGIYSFSEGLAVVITNGKWGYIDKSGKTAIAPLFEYAFPFSEGLAAVIVNNKFGYVDKTGQVIITPQFSTPRGPLGHEEEGSLGFGLPYSFSGGLAAALVGNKWGYIDRTGTFVVSPQFDEAGPFIEGLAQVEIDGRLGYIDKQGKYIWNPMK